MRQLVLLGLVLSAAACGSRPEDEHEVSTPFVYFDASPDRLDRPDCLGEAPLCRELSPVDCNGHRLPVNLGHRGIGWNDETNPYPENTVLSIARAFETGAGGVEVDILKTKDDVIVLAHENNLAYDVDGYPKTDCTGKITESDWDEIKECHALSYMEDGFQTKLDRLEWLLDLPHLGVLVLDVKNDDLEKEREKTVDVIVSALEQRGLVDQTVLMLYNYETIEYAAELGVSTCYKRHKKAGLSDAEIAAEVAESPAFSICVYYKLLSDSQMKEFFDHGVEVITYFIADGMTAAKFEEGFEQHITWGLFGVINDRVEQAVEILSAHQ